jgi:N-acetylmuramoyl-L-alanine amidase
MEVRKKLLVFATLWLVASPIFAQGRLQSHRLAGDEYVEVAQLAQFYGLGRDGSRAADASSYKTSWAELVLKANSREAIINGVKHWLNSPPLFARGRLWVTKLDVDKVIDPVLRGGRTAQPLRVRVVVLDAGHGGNDRGARSASGRMEKELTLDLTRRAAKHLEAAGLQVKLTRTRDVAVTLERRVEIAAAARPDLFVSLHFNAASSASASGIETYCLPPVGASSAAAREHGNSFDAQNVWLAHCIQKSAIEATGATDRGVRRARFYLLRQMRCPAVLFEGGFLSNPREAAQLEQAAHREKLARAVAEGILMYKRSVETPAR